MARNRAHGVRGTHMSGEMSGQSHSRTRSRSTWTDSRMHTFRSSTTCTSRCPQERTCPRHTRHTQRHRRMSTFLRSTRSTEPNPHWSMCHQCSRCSCGRQRLRTFRRRTSRNSVRQPRSTSLPHTRCTTPPRCPSRCQTRKSCTKWRLRQSMYRHRIWCTRPRLRPSSNPVDMKNTQKSR